MNVFRDLLRIKVFREDQAELRVRHDREQLQDARQARADAEALLARLLREGMETEHRLYRELCERIVHLREIEEVQQAVAGLRRREATQEDAVQASQQQEQQAQEALQAAREALQEATRQREKFIDLSANFDTEQAHEAERKEDLEMEEAASVRRDKEEWDAPQPEEAAP